MPSLTTRRPRANPVYQTLQVEDLTGGLDLRRTPSLLDPKRARVLTNFSLAEPGALRVRSGWTAFSSVLSTQAPQGGQRIYLGSTQGTLIAWDGGVYLLPDSGTWSTTPDLSGLSTANQIHFIYDRNLVTVLDGASTAAQKSTNLTTWTRLGIAPSTVKSTASSGGSGSDFSTSEFAFVYTYKDRALAFESDPTTAASTISLKSTGLQITLNIPNSTDPQVDAIVVYAKNVTSGETVYRKASSAAQSTAASSTIVLNSSAWSANDEAPSTHGLPPPLSFGVNWKNRWWARHATTKTRLYFTEIFQPQGWPALYYIDLPFENGDEIVALKSQGDTLLVFGQSSVFLVIGQTSLDFEVRPSLGAQGGALGPRAVAAIEAGVAHASAEGVFIFDGAQDTLLSHDITPGWRDLIDNAGSTAVANVSMVYDWRNKELRIAVPRLYPRATAGEWVLDLNRTRENTAPSWADTDRTIQHYIFWDGDEPVQGNRGRLQSYPSTGAQVFDEATGTTANGSDMTAQYTGATMSAGLHKARFTDLHLEYEPHAGSFTAESVVDGVSQSQIGIGIGSGLAQYGSTAVYGTAVYGGSGRRKAYTPLPLTSEGRTVYQNFVYTGQESFALYTYALGMVPEPAPRQMTE